MSDPKPERPAGAEADPREPGEPKADDGARLGSQGDPAEGKNAQPAGEAR